MAAKNELLMNWKIQHLPPARRDLLVVCPEAKVKWVLN